MNKDEAFFDEKKTEPTFFFSDLETSGLDPKNDRIMQFAGMRTDLKFNPIGEPVNLLVKFPDDTLPSPGAINVTKITPQQTLQDGLTEPEFCKYVQEEIFTHDTIAIGYNSIRFDDEYMRYTFYRNFYDPYEWEWRDGRSRWDLLDVVRLTRALRPEGIKWPVSKAFRKNADGKRVAYYKPTNRLELLTSENGIVHTHAHDALSDVEALISVTKMISEKQPSLYKYLFKMRDKKAVKKLVNLDKKEPFVYTSGRYPSSTMHTTVAFPLTAGANGNVVVFDLRYNLDELLKAEKNFVPEEKTNSKGIKYKTTFSWGVAVKELAFNRCPAVAPTSVLDIKTEVDSTDKANPFKKGTTGWEKIGLEKKTVEKNLKSLLKHPDFAERMRELFEEKKGSYETPEDVDGQLYEGFTPDSDRLKMQDVRKRNANELADLHPMFEDSRLPELLLHYKGRNFPTALDENEQKKWEAYRVARLRKQEKPFLDELDKLKDSMDISLLEDLMLWYQSLASSDY